MPNESAKPTVLHRIKQAGSKGVTLEELLEGGTLGSSTVRRHLKSLTEDGAITRFPMHKGSQGRPSYVYVIR